MWEELTDAERLERVRIAVERLPERRRNMFLLCRVEGWTFQQIADVYGISRDRVQREIARTIYTLTREVFHDERPSWWRRWF